MGRVAFSSEAEQMMSETTSVLSNMDDQNHPWYPFWYHPVSWWLLLYFCTGGCEIPRSCGWGGQFLPLHAHLFQVSFQGSEALPKRQVWGDACRCSVSLTPGSSCYLLVFGWRESRLQHRHEPCVENHSWQQHVVSQWGEEAKPSVLAAVAAPRRVESSRLLEKRSCEVGAFVSCW